MPDGNGDYLSRFERVEKTLDRIAAAQENLERRQEALQQQQEALHRQQQMQQRQIDALTRDVVTLHGTLKGLKENTDRLLVALRELIDRIPPENLR